MKNNLVLKNKDTVIGYMSGHTLDSINEQKERMIQFASSNQFAIEKFHIDLKALNSKMSDDFIDEIIRLSKSGHSIKLLTTHSNLIARDMYEKLMIIESFLSDKIEIIEINNYSDDKHTRFLNEILEGIDQFCSERITNSMIRLAKEGHFLGGRIPFALQIDPQTKRITVNKSESYIVKKIFELYIQGNTVTIISNILKASGNNRRDGREFSNREIYKILRNSKYKGTFEMKFKMSNQCLIYNYETILIENCFESIVSTHDFDITQQLLNRKKVS